MSETIQPLSTLPLGELLRTVLQEKQLTNRALASKAGISETAVRTLLKRGSGKELTRPHPLVLRGVAEVLGLDQVHLFQLAGYIAPDYEPPVLSADAQYVGLCFDTLMPDKQTYLIRILHTMKEAAGQ